MPSDGRRDARNTRDTDTAGTPSRSQDKEKSKGRSMNGTLDGWVEPSLATKPSFEDHGGAPYGVLEHMQPLGEAPSTRVRARVKGDGARKSMLGRGAGGAGLDAQETPEGTPGPQASSQAAEALPPLPPIAMDDDDDDDYAPGKKAKKKDRAAKTRAAKRTSESAAPSIETAPPSGKGRGKSKKVVAKAVPEEEQDVNINQNQVYNPAKLKAVVEEAKRRAFDAGKPSLAAAVEEIYQQSLTNQRLTVLLEAILLQNATKEQTTEFQGYVRAAKRKLRDEERKQPAAAEADGEKPLPVRSPHKTEQTANMKEEPPVIPSTEKTEVARPKFSIKVKSPPKPEPARRSSHGAPKAVSPVKQQTKDAGDDDLSDLSELTEFSEGEEMAVDTPDEFDEMSAGPPSKVNGTKAKDQAAERGSLGVQGSNLKRSSADAEIHETEDDRALSAKKLKLSGTVKRDYDYTESNVRDSMTGQSRGARGQTAKNASVVPPKITLQPNGGSATRSARSSRAISIDADSPLSSPAGSSRRSTPHVWKGPPKQSGKRAKTKTSPEKKNQHSYGGLSGAGGAGRDSPIGDDDNEERSENNDFCSSCGGSGLLLCCDGCDRAFHFACLDPPIGEEASELNEPWYCFICVAKRPVTVEQPEKPARGLFAPLLNSLNRSNPRTFQLPEYVRNYFDGVATGKDGEFTEAVKPKTRTRGGYDEKPDDYKLKDNKGNDVLCYACNKSSLGKRPIVTCDYCGQHWHLDCHDPPLANPPNRDALGCKKGDWMCPLHADHELRELDTRLLKPARPARRVHIRRPRLAKTKETALQRGLANNGIIEIADDDSDATDSEFFEEDRDSAIVYKLPQQGIRLDFIDKVKQTRVQDFHKRLKLDNATNAAPSALGHANFTRRSIREQQTALSLAQFANANSDLDLSGDRVENLVGALIAEAPDEVIDGIAATEGQKSANVNGVKASPSPPSSQPAGAISTEERKELENLQELIRRKLEAANGS